MKTAVLYVRVSTDEQAEKGYSIRHQEEQLRKYCEVNGIQVLQLYKEDYSAKTFNRPEIRKMLLSFKHISNRPNLFLFTKWDRFSRETGSAYEMIKTLTGLGIEPQAIDQPVDLSVPENHLMLAFYIAAPHVENLRRSLNVIGGMRKARKEGRLAGMAPAGYKNITNENGDKTIIPSSEAPIIIWVFHELYSNNQSVESIRQESIKRGLNISKSHFYRMIRLPTYCGLINIPAYKDEPEITVKGIHEPLISEELFFAVQGIIDGRVKSQGYKVCAKPELPLRGFLTCPTCGNNLTGSASTGGSGKKRFYYHCRNGCPERVPAVKVNEDFYALLNEFQFQPDVEELYKKIIENLFESEDNNKTKERQLRKEAIGLYETQLENMRLKLANNEISSDDFNSFKATINPKLGELRLLDLEILDSDSDLKKYLRKGLMLVKGLGEVYSKAPLEGKQKLIRSIFKENLVFQENRVRTGKLNEAVALIGRFVNGFGGDENKTGGHFGLLSLQVPGIGVEPI